MHVCKYRMNEPGPYPVDRQVFERETGKQLPWYRKEDGKERAYAICEACESPVQLIGLFEPLAHSERPYGKHMHRPVKGLGRFDPSVFEWCPYVRRSNAGGKAGKRPLEGVSLKILALVLAHFDRVLRILEQETGMRFSHTFAQKLLESWLDGEGYRYTNATLRNVPWMVGYRARGLNPFGQQITDNDGLREAILKAIPEASIDETGRIGKKGEAFYPLSCAFQHHKVSWEDGAMHESMIFEVRSAAKQPIYEQRIEIRPEAFSYLLGLPPDKAKRGEKRLALARDVYRSRFKPAVLERIETILTEEGDEA